MQRGLRISASVCTVTLQECNQRMRIVGPARRGRPNASASVPARSEARSPVRRVAAGPLANDNGVACGEREAIV